LFLLLALLARDTFERVGQRASRTADGLIFGLGVRADHTEEDTLQSNINSSSKSDLDSVFSPPFSLGHITTINQQSSTINHQSSIINPRQRNVDQSWSLGLGTLCNKKEQKRNKEI